MVHPPDFYWINFVQQLRNPIFDGLIKSLNFFDRQEFFFIVLPIIWLCYHWQLGRKIFYLLFISILTNMGLKEFFAAARPFQIDPSVGLIHVEGYSFPSGAAQSSIIVAGLIIYYWKSPWRWPLAISYCLAISFSRIYLGVHFPKDILGGWLVGLVIWAIYVGVFPTIERITKRWPHFAIFAAMSAIFITLITLFPTTHVMMAAGAAGGIEVGVFLTQTFLSFAPLPANWVEFFIRAILGPIGIFAIYVSLMFLLSFHLAVITFAFFFLIGLWLSFISNIICLYLHRQFFCNP
jgi:undecaprenyl-diphosphatase